MSNRVTRLPGSNSTSTSTSLSGRKSSRSTEPNSASLPTWWRQQNASIWAVSSARRAGMRATPLRGPRSGSVPRARGVIVREDDTMARGVAGGLDSTTVAALARREGYDLAAVSVDYGQTHQREIEAARAITAALGLHSRKARCWLLPTPSLPSLTKV